MSHKLLNFCILLLLTSLLLGSCYSTPFEIPINKVDCYFKYESVNYAWGFSHGGFIITPSGEMYTFDKTTPWVFSDNNLISLTTLQNNIKASVKMDTLIPATDLEYYQHLALSALNGNMSKPVNRGNDMGGAGCSVIVPDPSNPPNGYREVILTQTGDIEFHNLAPQAAVIAAWLLKMR